MTYYTYYLGIYFSWDIIPHYYLEAKKLKTQKDSDMPKVTQLLVPDLMTTHTFFIPNFNGSRVSHSCISSPP